MRAQIQSCSHLADFNKIIEHFFADNNGVRFIVVDFLYPMHHSICEDSEPVLREEIRFSHVLSNIVNIVAGVKCGCAKISCLLSYRQEQHVSTLVFDIIRSHQVRDHASRSQYGQALGPDHMVCRALCVLPPSTTWSRDVSVPGGTGRTGGIRHAARRGVAPGVPRPAPSDCRTETFLKRGFFRKVC